jgi:hypothetical protein
MQAVRLLTAVVVVVVVTVCRWLSGPSVVGKDRNALSAGSRGTGRMVLVLFDLENEGAITLRKLADFSPNDAATQPRELESLV